MVELIDLVDATKSAEQKRLLEIELDAVGIRLNARRPDVVFKPKTAGGVSDTVSLHALRGLIRSDHHKRYGQDDEDG